MTRFTMTNDVAWGSGGTPRNVTIMTENQAGFDAYASKAKGTMRDSVRLLENACRQLRAMRIDKSVSAYANRYFLTGASLGEGDALAILTVLQKTLNGLNNKFGALALKVVAQDADAYGFIVARPGQANNHGKAYHNTVASMDTAAERRIGAIHIEGDTLLEGRLGAVTLIHEATHKYAGTTDYCYFDNDSRTPETDFTDKAKAMTNADSFAWFAVKVGRGNALTKHFGFNSKM